MATFSVRFWGVRGSLATSAPGYAAVGGNTSCVEIRAGDRLIILDAGTGLFQLGQTLVQPARATFFISHYHWDHIQGFPFFRPAYAAANRFTLYGPGKGELGLKAALARQMEAPHFPVTLAAMHAQLDFRSIESGEGVSVGPVRVRALALNHPQGCLGYRISFAGRSVVYATDTEHIAPGVGDPGTSELARNADLLIYDSQYTDDEYYGRGCAARQGFGHSTIEEACRLARAADVKQLAIFHHDPSHDDAYIEELTEEAHALFPNLVVAREGLSIDLLRLHALRAQAA